MGEFFKGWRRKGGCVTLAVTLALMAGWMRSLVTRDVLPTEICGGLIVSDDQAIRFEVWVFQTSRTVIYAPYWSIPYWSLILPLTLLSAWLILGKRRLAKSTGLDSGPPQN